MHRRGLLKFNSLQMQRGSSLVVRTLTESVCNMNERKCMILIVKYDEDSERKIEELIKSVEKPINAKYGKVLRAYQGSEEEIVSAVEKILQLAK